MSAMDEHERKWLARDLREAILGMAMRYAESKMELASGKRMPWSGLRGVAATDAARYRACQRRFAALMRLTNALAKMAGG